MFLILYALLKTKENLLKKNSKEKLWCFFTKKINEILNFKEFVYDIQTYFFYKLIWKFFFKF